MLACVIWWLVLRLVGAPVPCKPTLAEEVQVGDVVALVGPSRTILHLESQERDCAIVTFGYEGLIVISCYEGTLNISTDGCSPRRCQPSQSITVRLGEDSVSASPLNIIASGGQEVRLCRNLNPIFRNTYIMYCNFGEVTVDTRECVTQWDPMGDPPWTPRSRQASAGLSDGAVLMLGGLGNEGPIQEVWQWTPSPTNILEGAWSRTEKLPPWNGRFDAAAIQQVTSESEQVVLMGGNDNQNRGDVWRWLRSPAIIELQLDESEETGSQARECVSHYGRRLSCHASAGVSGRKWHISHYLEMSTEIHIELLHSGGDGDLPPGAAGVGAAVVALELDSCRQIFRAEGGRWSTTGCTGDQPPWARADQPAVRLGPSGAAFPGQARNLRFVLDRENQEIIMYSDNVLMAPAGASEGQLGVPVGGGVCRDYSGGNGSVGCPDKSSPVSVMFLRTVELVVWPEATLEIRRLAVMAPAGYWQQQVDIAPWPARSAHVAVTLPEGDILLMGGVGEPGLLNDVWRWTPRKCTLLEDMQPLEAARFGLECSYKCTSSPIYGQWAQLLDAPWAPRSEPGAVWTASGVILAGGRSSLGYENDVWVWQHSGDFCSVQWQGTWTQLTPQAAWFPRHGHRLVGFVTPGSADVDTVLLVGGFGGEPDSGEVIRGKEPDPADRPNPRNDIWCGNKDLSNWGKWTQIAPTAPFSARAQFAAVIAPTISDFSFVLFGGYDDNARLVVDQWQWTGENTTFRCEVQESTATEY